MDLPLSVECLWCDTFADVVIWLVCAHLLAVQQAQQLLISAPNSLQSSFVSLHAIRCNRALSVQLHAPVLVTMWPNQVNESVPDHTLP